MRADGKSKTCGPSLWQSHSATCVLRLTVWLPTRYNRRESMDYRTLRVERLGRVEYGAALENQKQTERAVLNREQPDTLILLEHPHTLTLGRRATEGGIIAPEEVLRTRGVTVFETNRGGKVTYHGLGQIVGYPIINLSPDREDVHRYVRDLEEVLIRTMSDFGIDAFPIKGLTGVHTSRGKVAAIGVHIARWVTTHGFALNVNTDLSYFNLIIACEGEPVTSMKDILGHEINMSEVQDRIVERFGEVFEMETSDEVSTGSGSDRVATKLRSSSPGVLPGRYRSRY
jgi:lipoyl(octanoyl) transferase